MGRFGRRTCQLLVIGIFALGLSGSGHAGVVFDAHKWKYPELMGHMGAIKDAGFTAVLVSPHQKSCGGGFSEGFDPYDFRDFNSRFGSETDLFCWWGPPIGTAWRSTRTWS